jgi:DNA (cytosine-5)-methyltransferase 1
LENVRGLRSIENGSTLKEIVRALQHLNYSVPEPVVLNARDFGLPQNRNRLFIVAIREELTQGRTFKFPEPTVAREDLKVKQILEDSPSPTLTISETLWLGHQRRKAHNKAAGKGFGYQLFDGESNYTATLSARYYKDGSEILIRQDDDRPRLLSVREAASLQGFPSWFVPHKSRKEAYKQFGNAVPVAVIQAIAQELKQFLID